VQVITTQVIQKQILQLVQSTRR